MSLVPNWIKHSLLPLLRTEWINRLVFRIRFLYYVVLRRNVRCHTDDVGVAHNAYSAGMLTRGITSDRPLHLIRPLSVLQNVNKGGKTLSIGCRFETELLYLFAYGFRPRNVLGLDMVSYSPWVKTGNMHAMDFDDNTWDTTLVGWTLPYSNDRKKAASEIIRVTKPGGIVAIGASTYGPEFHAERKRRGEPELLKSSDEYLSLFGSSVDKVLYRNDPATPETDGVTVVIFSVKKNRKAAEGSARKAA